MDRRPFSWAVMSVMLVVALLAGSYLAGQIVTVWLGVSAKVVVGLDTYWQYLLALGDARVARHVWPILLSGLAGLGLPLLAWAAWAHVLLRRRPARTPPLPAWPAATPSHARHTVTTPEPAVRRQSPHLAMQTVTLEATGSVTPPTVLSEEQEEAMKLQQIAAATLTAGALTATALATTACEPTHNSAGEKVVIGDQFDITKNPEAKHKYKLHVRIKDAPGAFEYANMSVGFDIANIQECGYYLGGSYQGIVPGVKRNIRVPLTKISATDYEAEFYIDWGKDGDFFGKGVCHWKFTSVGVGFAATEKPNDTRFINGLQPSELAASKSSVLYYRKKVYPVNEKFLKDIDYGMDDEFAKLHPAGSLFSIMVSAQEVQP